GVFNQTDVFDLHVPRVVSAGQNIVNPVTWLTIAMQVREEVTLLALANRQVAPVSQQLVIETFAGPRVEITGRNDRPARIQVLRERAQLPQLRASNRLVPVPGI